MFPFILGTRLDLYPLHVIYVDPSYLHSSSPSGPPYTPVPAVRRPLSGPFRNRVDERGPGRNRGREGGGVEEAYKKAVVLL